MSHWTSFLLQTDSTQIPWWASNGTAIVVAVLSFVIAPFISSWVQSRKKSRETSGHITDTSLSIGAQERREAIAQMKELHIHEIDLFKRQLKEKDRLWARQVVAAKVVEYEARQRAHAYGGECQRLQGFVYRMQIEGAQQGLEFTEFTFRTYPEIMAGIEDKVIEYQKQLEQEILAPFKEEQ